MEDTNNLRNRFQPLEQQTKEMTGPLNDRQFQVGAASLLAGSAVALFGLTRHSSLGKMLAAFGAGLALTGAKSCNDQLTNETMVRRVLMINRPRHEVYERWRRLEDLPRDMENLQSVERADERYSHWSGKRLLGYIVAWDAETTEQAQDTLIAWRSLPGATVPNHGWVRFSDALNGRGTNLDLTMSCRLPAGRIGAMIARLSGRSPQAQVDNDLRRFKAILEAGEAPTTADQPAGERGPIGRLANAWAAAH